VKDKSLLIVEAQRTERFWRQGSQGIIFRDSHRIFGEIGYGSPEKPNRQGSVVLHIAHFALENSNVPPPKEISTGRSILKINRLDWANPNSHYLGDSPNRLIETVTKKTENKLLEVRDQLGYGILSWENLPMPFLLFGHS
jgi:hypothetical protein